MKKKLLALAVSAAALTLVALPAGAGDGPGFKTAQPAMLKGVAGTTVTPKGAGPGRAPERSPAPHRTSASMKTPYNAT